MPSLPLQRIIRRAGVEVWPKLWQNLRASRATELADAFPSHVCASWLGHTEAIADAHYRQTTDAHFARASGSDKAKQIPKQQPRADEGERAHPEQSDDDESAMALVSCDAGAESPARELIQWAGSDSNRRLNDYESSALGR